MRFKMDYKLEEENPFKKKADSGVIVVGFVTLGMSFILLDKIAMGMMGVSFIDAVFGGILRDLVVLVKCLF